MTTPHHGWTEFSLTGTSTYSLSYLNDIAFEWVEQAIHGLETLYPFCVKGCLEPDRCLCIVSHWNCHIVVEPEDRTQLSQNVVQGESSHTSMLDFCQYLYHDISANAGEWASFYAFDIADGVDEAFVEGKKRKLLQMLARLKELIAEKQEAFGENRGFW